MGDSNWVFKEGWGAQVGKQVAEAFAQRVRKRTRVGLLGGKKNI